MSREVKRVALDFDWPIRIEYRRGGDPVLVIDVPEGTIVRSDEQVTDD